MRSPLLPAHHLLRVESDGQDDRMRHANELLSDLSLREAVMVATPSLHDALTHPGDRAASSRRTQRAESAAFRYLIRAAGRSEPFGAFAGLSTGQVVESGCSLEIPDRAIWRRLFDVDSEYVFQLLEDATANAPGLWAQRLYEMNPTLYRVGDGVRYVESSPDHHGDLRYRLVSIPAASHVDALLAAAALPMSGAAISNVVAQMLQEGSLDDVRDLVKEAIRLQLLVPTDGIHATGHTPLQSAIAYFERHQMPLAGTLRQVALTLGAATRQPVGHAIEAVEAAKERLPAVSRPRQTLSAMLFKSTGMTLPQALVDEVISTVHALHRISRPAGQELLRDFALRFSDRFGDQCVPLMQALDPDTGAGFQESLGKMDSEGDLAQGGDASPEPEYDRGRATVLSALYSQAVTRGPGEVILNPTTLASLEVRDRLPLPDSLAVLFSILAESSQAIEEGRYRLVVKAIAGPSGIRILGRFGHFPEVGELIARHLALEEALRSDVVFAEIVHVPNSTMANVVCRPVVRDYEIPFFGLSGARRDRQIPVSDLTVTVVGGEIRLHSRRLRRRVLPRLTSAHNFNDGSAVPYRFLSALQAQGVSPVIGWNWGVLGQVSYLPRVSLGRAIVSRRSWRLTRGDIGMEQTAGGGENALSLLRDSLGLPRWVVVSQGGQEFPVDLEHRSGLAFIQWALDRSDAIRAYEMLPDPSLTPVSGKDGKYLHEVVLPLARAKGPHKESVTSSPLWPSGESAVTLSRAVEHRFSPGSEWVFVELYGGPGILDEIIDSVRRCFDSEACAEWFFVRYDDPSSHVRVRFREVDAARRQLLWDALIHVAVEATRRGLLWKHEGRSYVRETHRYGGGAFIEAAEQIFCADSRAVAEALALPQGRELVARFHFLLHGIHRLFSDFKLDLRERADALSTWLVEERSTYAAKPTLRAWIADKYRRERAYFEAFAEEEEPWRAILDERSVALLGPAARYLSTAPVTPPLSFPVTTVLRSFVHMHANRVLREPDREQEVTALEFLSLYYRSMLARSASEASR